jgi:hypothetical protein
MRTADLDFARDGAARFRGVLSASDVAGLCAGLDPAIDRRPGRRLPGDSGTGDLLPADGLIGRIAAGLIGPSARPVRAVLFDKTPAANWIVAWHQDRTICVRERIEIDGFGPWSTKDGLLHVAPPVAVLEGMATLRLHLDDCDDDNAPLKIALGSHRLGYVPAAEAATRAEAMPLFTCHASAGDVWAYSTPILHASERSRSDRRRRVLQVDYAAADLPGGLEWRGVA